MLLLNFYDEWSSIFYDMVERKNWSIFEIYDIFI